MFLSPMCRAAATATVRTVKRKRMIPMRAALTLVSFCFKFARWKYIENDTYVKTDHAQTPAAVNRVKELIGNKSDCVSTNKS